jgi:hypothetical protein
MVRYGAHLLLIVFVVGCVTNTLLLPWMLVLLHIVCTWYQVPQVSVLILERATRKYPPCLSTLPYHFVLTAIHPTHPPNHYPLHIFFSTHV